MAPRNLSRRRKIRLAAVLTLAIVAAVVAWRSHPSGANTACTPGREEQRDSTGKLVRIVRTECLR